MAVNWFTKYRRSFQNTRFISQFGTFFVSISAFLSFGTMIRAIYYNFTVIDSLWNELIISIIFHILIGIIFAIRFGFLFFKSNKSFWIAQILWLISMILIGGFYVATKITIYGSLFPLESSASPAFDNYPMIFLYTRDFFTFCAVFYFFASPIRQIITAIAGSNKSK